ncbi:hypothetical protein FA95DRAFT_1611191 [Auriscalpium vulgare]|uniref:Uncharacterized protein n=1 Tax=Auriscalpium vulgare TaxID=40419 RepID=A0ACB8RCA9_9AGAM|nr:hypothetical protein FA95DRAFT_1611191 [Auriscalpium vulgare]
MLIDGSALVSEEHPVPVQIKVPSMGQQFIALQLPFPPRHASGRPSTHPCLFCLDRHRYDLPVITSYSMSAELVVLLQADTSIAQHISPAHLKRSADSVIAYYPSRLLASQTLCPSTQVPMRVPRRLTRVDGNTASGSASTRFSGSRRQRGSGSPVPSMRT